MIAGNLLGLIAIAVMLVMFVFGILPEMIERSKVARIPLPPEFDRSYKRFLFFFTIVFGSIAATLLWLNLE
jgi:hypothetical protein